MNVGVFQFNGCEKCFAESMLLKEESGLEVQYFQHPNDWKGEKLDLAVISGFLTPDDRPILDKIAESSANLVSYGSCAVTGGIFGLAYQKGKQFLPMSENYPNSVSIHGCLAEIEELKEVVNFISQKGPISQDNPFDWSKNKALCNTCARTSECLYLEEVHRQIDVTEDEEQCFNDLGLMCNGYVARECKENCVAAGAPCRGCKQNIDRPGLRMIGMFGTFMGEIEVATEANKYGATDKLADEDDEITAGVPDVTGNFFRFHLPTSTLPIGRIPSTGNLMGDVFTGRLIEELPLITGMMGSRNAIGLTLDVLEAYEQGIQSQEEPIEVSEKTKSLRAKLRELEKDWQKAIDSQDLENYKKISAEIRKIAGNMNLSRLTFGGFRTPIKEEDDFESYHGPIFTIYPGNYAYGSVKYSLNEIGQVTAFSMEEK